MSDDLLAYFNRELNYLRRRRQEFSEGPREIAERLKLTGDTIEDPHVARLIDAFAYLTARIQRKLDDDFPELTEALLNVLYPHYLAPIPSMGIIQLQANADIKGKITAPAGLELRTTTIGGDLCRFRMVYPVELWPIRLERAVLASRPSPAPLNRYAGNAVATLRLVVKTMKKQRLDELQPDRLRFYLRGEPSAALPLYQLIMAGTVSIAIANHPHDAAPVILAREHLVAVGFGPDEGMLPFGAGSSHGYQLLTEYFAFPEKFLFFEITGLGAKTLLDAEEQLEIFLYLDRTDPALEQTVSADSFALGCTPIVNLFPQRAEPIRLTQHIHEYRVVADARRQTTTEIYAVEQVTGSAAGGRIASYAPFYRPEHDPTRDDRRYWYAARRQPTDEPRTETYLSLVDLNMDPGAEQNWTLSVDTLCFNADLPQELPIDDTHVKLQLVDGGNGITGSTVVRRPTATVRPSLGRQMRWRLISHLSLNHLSLAGKEPLREILQLYDHRRSVTARAVIEGIDDVRSKIGTARIVDAPNGLCRGLDIEVQLADSLAPTGEAYLLASVLDRFFGAYVTINSFSRLTLRFIGGAQRPSTWPARAGDRLLL
jgi:type VI secretion system protein ImpG